MFLLAAILAQPLRGEPFGETTGPVSTGNVDANLPYAAVTPENRLGECTGTCCPTCVAGNTSKGCRYFFADALFWTVREGYNENWAQIITPKGDWGSNVGTATLVDAPFDWRTGFRVGAGLRRDDGFDATLYYTNFSTSAASQASGEVYSSFMGNFYVGNADGLDFGPHYRHGSIQWDFDYHSIDLEIGRNYAIDANLELHPFLGLKAAIINQSLNSSWRDPINTTANNITHTYNFTSATEYLDLHFWGIGPSLGATITMPLCTKPRYTLKLFGTPSGAIMLGHWTSKEQYDNDGVGSSHTSVAIDMSPITGAATMLRGVVGLEWEQYFCRTTSTVRLGYESQIWLNQMQIYSYNMGRMNNLTSLQGGFLELCIGY
ncbi:MAG: Lpg1974 family pore-forming outer membrane protein [Thermoguttaceae bacterium]